MKNKPMNDKSICGAKNRQGNPCQKSPMKGRTRCRLHGGLNTGEKIKGNKNAVKHGIYSRTFTEEELNIASEIELGTVDNELVALRIQLLRAYELQKKSNEDIENGGDGILQVSETEELIGGEGGYNKTVKRAIDFNHIISTLTSKIESLERTRLALKQASNQSDSEPEYDQEYTLQPDEEVPEKPRL